MANITLEMANTGVKVPVLDIDLESVTNEDLIEAVLTHLEYMDWDLNLFKIIGKDNYPCLDKATLSSLGFVDGDTIRIAVRPGGKP